MAARLLAGVDAGALMTAALEPSRPRIEAGGIELGRSGSDPNLYQQVMANPSQIERVLARISLPTPSARRRVGAVLRIEGHRTRDRVEVSVADTGRGIPKGGSCPASLESSYRFRVARQAAPGSGWQSPRRGACAGAHGGDISAAFRAGQRREPSPSPCRLPGSPAESTPRRQKNDESPRVDHRRQNEYPPHDEADPRSRRLRCGGRARTAWKGSRSFGDGSRFEAVVVLRPEECRGWTASRHCGRCSKARREPQSSW